jgi:hypothetical protein
MSAFDPPRDLRQEASLGRHRTFAERTRMHVAHKPLRVGDGSQSGSVMPESLTVQSRNEVGWIASEAVWLICPRLTDRFVGR